MALGTVLLLVYVPGAAQEDGSTSAWLDANERLIVRLDGPSVIEALNDEKADLRLLNNGAALERRCELQEAQNALARSLEEVSPGAVVERQYQVTFNGLSVRLLEPLDAVREKVLQLPGVSHVYEEMAYSPSLYASVPFVQADALWADLGGRANAGQGIKVAVLDSGIDITHPMVDASSFLYPPGFPKGDGRCTSEKVIAARAYFRPSDPPLPGEETPMPGPLGSGHGTYMAGIIAGRMVTATHWHLEQALSGVAPAAQLLNYRIFYPSEKTQGEVAYTTEILAAIEDAVMDGADILCNSWSSVSPRTPFACPEAEALEAAMEAGCVVVAPVGNEGPGYGSASRIPGGIGRVITVGSLSKDRVLAHDFVDVTGPSPVPQELVQNPFARALFGPQIDAPIGPLLCKDVREVDPSESAFACDGLPESSLTDNVAFISRGECTFANKVYNAQEAGAQAVLIYNDEDNVEEMACGGEHCNPGEITIPAFMVKRSFGEALLARLEVYPDTTIRIDPYGRIISTTANVVAASSGRGPAYLRYLKPDLVAPGVSVLSADHRVTGGEVPYMQISGSSVACAHVAGVAALLRQAHPEWKHDDVKAALMSTAQPSGLYLDDSLSEEASVLERGAGLVRAAKAADSALLFSPSAISLPEISPGETRSLSFTLRDPRGGGDPRIYTPSLVQSEGITVTVPPEVTVPPGTDVQVQMTITADEYCALGEHELDLYYSGDAGRGELPIWLHVVPALKGADVLLIDNDFSFFEQYVDYAPYVIEALDQTPFSYDVWNADAHFLNAQTIPDIGELQRYDAVIWLTGDNIHSDTYYAVSVPLTAIDMHVLAAYLDGGGRLLAIGQNLAEASDINEEDDDPVWGRADFYHGYLGAHWLQGSLFGPEGEGTLPPAGNAAVVGLSDAFLSDVNLNLGPEGDGAGNQTSIDEIAPGGMPDGSDLNLVEPVLRALQAQPLKSGYVGLAKGDDPDLDDFIPSFPYRSLYYSFGFEGINDVAGDTTSRVEFLQRSLDWLLDDVTVQLAHTFGAVNVPTTISARATSSHGEIRSYRWRIEKEQGAEIVTTEEPSISPMWDKEGTYSLVVETTDSLGHTAIAQSEIEIQKGGSFRLVADEKARVGGQIRYRMLIDNTSAESVSASYTFPLPMGTEYVSHSGTGGEFNGNVWTWEGELDPYASSLCEELCVQVKRDVQPGTTITGTAYITASGNNFTRHAWTSIWGPMYLPLTLNP
ncbi:MAG: S8 family serine peptidase [Chloroflexota bacterium]|nr:S8 family serine peptidase [Chloroflexota bacterium]